MRAFALVLALAALPGCWLSADEQSLYNGEPALPPDASGDSARDLSVPPPDAADLGADDLSAPPPDGPDSGAPDLTAGDRVLVGGARTRWRRVDGAVS